MGPSRRSRVARYRPTIEQEAQEALKQAAARKVYNLVQLVYRSRDYEGHSKDYEFSRISMNEHWRGVTTMPCVRFAIAEFSSGRQISWGCRHAISRKMDENNIRACRSDLRPYS